MIPTVRREISSSVVVLVKFWAYRPAIVADGLTEFSNVTQVTDCRKPWITYSKTGEEIKHKLKIFTKGTIVTKLNIIGDIPGTYVSYMLHYQIL